MEEIALSHIITAESEKIQFAIDEARKKPGCNLCSVLKVNKSVDDLLDKVNDIQILLKSKLRIAARFVPDIDPPCPPDPPIPPPPKPCTSVFLVADEYCWRQDMTLRLDTIKHCANRVKLGRHGCDKVILLPPGKTYKITFELDIKKTTAGSISVEMALGYGNTNVRIKEYKGTEPHFKIQDTQIWETSGAWQDHFLAIRLRLPEAARVTKGKIMVTECY